MCYHCAEFLLSMSSMVPIADGHLLGSIVDRFTFDPAVSSTKQPGYGSSSLTNMLGNSLKTSHRACTTNYTAALMVSVVTLQHAYVINFEFRATF